MPEMMIPGYVHIREPARGTGDQVEKVEEWGLQGVYICIYILYGEEGDRAIILAKYKHFII